MIMLNARFVCSLSLTHSHTCADPRRLRQKPHAAVIGHWRNARAAAAAAVALVVVVVAASSCSLN